MSEVQVREQFGEEKQQNENQASEQSKPQDVGRDRPKPIKIPAVFGPDLLSPNDSALEEGRGRKSSITFQDTCDLYEIDLEKGEDGKKGAEPNKSGPSCCQSVRYYVILLTLISPFVVTYSRTIINFAITDMIDPEYIQKNDLKPPTSPVVTNQTTQPDVPYFDLDNSCPVSAEDRERLLKVTEEDIVRAHESTGEKFRWDGFSQGLLKAAYTIGHTPLQIPGSRMAEIYGPWTVMNICSLLIGLLCLLAPFMAAAHFYLIFINLILLGTLGSFMTPALITMFSNWLTPSERSLAISFYLVASRLGSAWSSLLCGLLIEAHFSWRYVFFSAGAFALVFCLLFSLGARSHPHDHPFIKEQELNYLAKKNTLVREALERKMNGHQPEQEMTQVGVTNGDKTAIDNNHTDGAGKQPEPESNKKPPFFKLWFSILSYSPVWAFIMTKFCVKMAGDVVSIELPTYLKRVMHFSAKTNGLINFRNYVTFCVGCLGVGYLVKVVTKAKPGGLGKTALRKLFQSIASFGVALTLLGLAFSVCQDTLTQFLLITFYLITTFSIGGEGQMPIDLTERYSGTLHSMASTISISGAIAPALVGYYVKGHEADQDRWQIVWISACILSSLGGVIFLIFGDANIQPFETLELEKADGERKDEKEVNNKVHLEKTCADNKAFDKDSEKLEEKEEGERHGESGVI